MKAIRALSMLMALNFLSACIPFPAKESPEIFGVVTDSATGAPIIGAQLCYANYPGLAAISNSQGAFKISAIRRWQFVWLGTDLKPAKALKVSARGYISKVVAVDLGGPSEYSISLRLAAQ